MKLKSEESKSDPLEQASAERRDLVPERCRSWSFQVVPGTSTTKNQIWNGILE